jgi:TRAP transporter 4TM/12TM fusion protein
MSSIQAEAESHFGEGEARTRSLEGVWGGVAVLFSALAVLLTVNQVFNLRMFANVVLLENRYLYLLLALLLPLVFLWFPGSAKAPRDRVPWYDALLFATTVSLAVYFAWTGERSVAEAWEFAAPPQAVALGIVFWGIILETARRTGGMWFFGPMLVLSFYPLYAESMPGPLAGKAFDFVGTASYHIMSNESVLGIPLQVFGSLIVGFIVFGTALRVSGGGQFFINISFALLGHVRGGPAKVAILASGLFGSLSGSVVSNVISTGSMTIPAMKRGGYESHYAAGVEACASVGGVLMPPVMGAAAFVMATFLGIPYSQVALAAALPAFLYYLGLFIQIDAYSVRAGIRGMPRKDLPSLGKTFREGWFYLFAFGLLVWLLLYLKRETHAPFYATAVLLAITQYRRQTRVDWRGARRMIVTNGKTLAELIAILAAVGLFIGGLVVTGAAGSFAGGLVRLAGGNVLALLIMGALTSFVLGLGMTITACYVLLAIVLAPAVVKLGLNPLAVHLFLLYWGMLSDITPPVCLGAFAAASIARAHPMRTGFEAMRLGSIIYFIPFFFVFNPALILQAPWPEVAQAMLTATAGIVLVAAGLQGYLLGAGILPEGPLGWTARGFLIAGGLLLAHPGDITDVIGLAIALPGVALTLWKGRPASSAYAK